MFDKTVEQLTIDIEEERLLAEAPAVPHVKPLDDHEIEKNMNETVNTILKQFYKKNVCKKTL